MSKEILAKSRRNKLTTDEKLQAERVCLELEMSGLFSETEKKLLFVAEETSEQSLKEHEQAVVEKCEEFPYKEQFSIKAYEMIHYCCKYHDHGKADELFQRKVNGEKVNDEPHGHISIYLLSYEQFKKECPHCDERDFGICLTAICHHHNRQSAKSPRELRDYVDEHVLKNAQEYFSPDIKRVNNESRLLFASLDTPPRVRDLKEFYEDYRRYQVIKGMLNTFDYMASADIDIIEKPSDIRRKHLVNTIRTRYPNLRDVQVYMADNHDKNLIVLGSTGIGKTEAALLWANGEKAFYTLPIKVSATEIYQRVRKKYGFEDAKILHSGALDVYLSEGDEAANDTLESVSLFTHPFIVCTADQILRFAYQAPGTERLAATMSYSKVIIDELQGYGPNTVAAIIYALVQIVQMGGKFCIMTATLPKFFIKKLNEELDRHGLSHAKPNVASFTTPEKRHMMQVVDGDFDYERILEEGKTKKVVVMCNTIKKAIEVSEKLKDANCLHSRYLPPDRRIIEQKLMEFSGNNEVGIWVTTQIAEASLDLDFDILFTEISTIESLIQRMGRVFRDGSREPKEPNVIVYNTDNWFVYDKDIHFRTVNVIKGYNNVLLTEDDKIAMVDRVYDEDALKKSDYYKTFESCYRNLTKALPNHYSLKEANQLFRDIDETVSVIPESVYNENQKTIEMLLDALEVKGLSKGARRLIRSKLAEFTISVHPKTFKEHFVKEVWPGVMLVSAEYDFNGDSGKGLISGEYESLIW